MILNIRHLDFVAEWMSRTGATLKCHRKERDTILAYQESKHATSIFVFLVCLFLLNSHHSEADMLQNNQWI